MSQDNTTLLIVAIVGLISTLLGVLVTILGNYISTRGSNKAEKRKLLRDKIEEAYLLSDELRRLAFAYLENTTILLNTGLSSELYVGNATKYLTEGHHLQTDRLKMLVKLYIPSIQEEVLKYTKALADLEVLKFPFTEQFLKEHKPDELMTLYNQFVERWIKTHRIKIEIPNDQSAADVLLIYIGREIILTHQTLQKSIENLVHKKDAV